ncbi:MAG: U32 family peptidase [Nanobdellota archaeon]
MVFSLATTFEHEIIDNLKELNEKVIDDKLKVTETFGAMITEFGSGRNSYRLPNVNYNELKDYINYSHENKIKFNYLINATCFSGKETSQKFINKLCNHLEDLSSMGVDIFTMANPILIKTAKENIKDIKINTSINSRIKSLEEVKRYLSLGIDRITLHYDLNRDFDFLKKVRSLSEIEIELLANNPCLYNCIFADYHMNMDSHGSRSATKMVNTLYPVFNCKDIRLRKPEEIIKSRWIMPKDVENYFDLGINIIKIAGRNLDKDKLLKAAEDYSQKKDFPEFYSQLIEKGLWRYVSRENPDLEELDIKVNLPDDFLDWFKEGKCHQDCLPCGHCENIANKCITFNSDDLRKKYLNISSQILNRELKKK